MSWATNNATARVFIVLKIDATFPGCLDSCDIGKPSCLDSCDIRKTSCLDSCDIGKPLMRFQWYLYIL